MRIRWHIWLVVWLILAVGGEGFGALLGAQGLYAAGEGVRWIGRLAASAWLVFGLVSFQQYRWVRQVSLVAVLTAGATLLALFCNAVDSRHGLIFVFSAYGMGMGFYLGTVAIRAVLSPGWPVLGVARTLIDEALRMKVPLVFIVALLLLVPVLPLSMDPAEKLQYRLQSFLSWSLIAVSLLLSLMTVFLSVGTVSNEISRRHIYLTLTKPVSRAKYLLGKWLGVALLNALLVAVAGSGIYLLTTMLARQSATSPADRAAAEQQVLTARRTIAPIGITPGPPHPEAFKTNIHQRLEELQRENPDRFGEPGTPADQLAPEARQKVLEDVRGKWYTLDARETRTYRFMGLDDIHGKTLQLRLKPQSGETLDSGRLHMRVEVNGRLYRHPTEAMMAGDNLKLIKGSFQVLDIPADWIADDDEMALTLTNVRVEDQDQSSIHFNTTDGMQLLHRVGGFGANLARGMAMTWVRLCFVAVVGIATGSLLGFPVASVLSLVVFATAMASGFLDKSLDQYAGMPDEVWTQPMAMLQQVLARFASGQIWAGMKVIVSLIGSGFMWLVPSFDQYDPAPLVSDGRVVSLRALGSAVLWVGVIWSGVVAGLGYLIFRRRELARITV